jgi:uncharacterized OB-fold protein
MLPWFEAHGPWAVVAVELAEGVRMVSNLVDIDPREFVFGMDLEADYLDVDSTVTLVVFRSPRKPS